jgi:hypothetical protein
MAGEWQGDGEPVDTADKYDWAPGVPADPSAIPRLYYQALLGNVYTLQRWPNGDVARGSVALADLEALVGGPVREGWYDALGKYLGGSIDLAPAAE